MKTPEQVTAEVYTKYRKGDPIGDTELQIAETYFSDLALKLYPLGDRFAFAYSEAHQVADVLRSFIQARKTK